MRDEAHIPFASPSKPKKPSSTFEASCGISQDTVSSHSSFPESGHMAFALQFINEGIANSASEKVANNNISGFGMSSFSDQVKYKDFDIFDSSLGRLVPIYDKPLSSLLGKKPVDGLRLTQPVWSKTENLLRSAEHFLAASLLNSDIWLFQLNIFFNWIRYGCSSTGHLLNNKDKYDFFQQKLFQQKAEFLENISVAESLKDSLLQSPLIDKMFGLSVQQVQEELSKTLLQSKLMYKLTMARGGPPSSAKKRKNNYCKPQNKSHNSCKSSASQEWEALIPITQPLFPHLQWWLVRENVMRGGPMSVSSSSQSNIIHRCLHPGLGGISGGLTISGVWNQDLLEEHINVLEMKAVLLALNHFQLSLKNQSVILATDNTTVVAYLKNQGGTHSPSLYQITRDILLLCFQLQVHLVVKHIAGHLNILADTLSRSFAPVNTKWELHQVVFKAVTLHWGSPQIDLFATSLNHKLATFVSPVPDPKSYAVDAMSLSWKGMFGPSAPIMCLSSSSTCESRHSVSNQGQGSLPKSGKTSSACLASLRDKSSVTLLTDPAFLAKNQIPDKGAEPVVIPALPSDSISVLLCPPFSSCYIGSPCPKSALAAIADQIDSNTNAEVKKKSPFKFIFPGQSKPSTEPGVKTVATGTQNEEWGSPIVLHGQIGSVCLFHDVITPSQIKTLYTLGPNKMNIFDDDDHTELNDLVNKSVLYYSAKAHKDGVVVDLTGNLHHGHLIGQCCVTWDIKDVINCIGGIQVLFPLLEQVNKSPIPENDEVTTLSNPVTISPTDDDWLLIRPSSSYADSKLEQNQAAGFLTLLRHMLHTSSTNRDTFTRINAAATIGAILQKVNCKLIDVHVLMSAQLLVDMATTTSRTLLQHLYQYILFDFRIWSKSHFPIRIGHIQYLSTIIKDDKKYFRKKFGVQFILDVIRMYYSSVRDSGLSSEDSKQIRVSLFSLVKFYIAREVTADELLHIIGFLVVAREENMICEILDVLISLLENPRKQDQLFLLLFEADMGEMLYGLLVHQGYSVVFYEKIVKVLYLLLKSDKVYEKSKTRLRLAEYTSQNYNSVLAILQLIHTCGSDIKLEATKQIISLLVSRPNAAKSFAKQLGWQESLVKLFIFRTFPDLPVNNSDHQLSSNLISEVTKSEITSDSTVFCSTVESDDVDNSQCDVSTICDNHKPGKHPDNLNLFLVCDNVSLTFTQDSGTPMFLNHIDDFNSSSEDLRLRSMSRSSTASLEDLSSSRRSQDRDSRISGFSINGPVDMNASISSFSDSRRSSGNLENEDLQQALDKLGIQSYLKDSGERLEEVCQNVIVILLMIMTKGVEGSNTDAWKERIQVFTWIDRIAEDNELIRPAIELKRRLFEMLVEANATEIRESGQALAGPSENARELIKFVRYFMLTEPSDDKFSVTLIEDVMSLMDNLAVWDVESDGGWKEMARLGLNLLILYGQFPDVEVGGSTGVKSTDTVWSVSDVEVARLGLNLLILYGQFPDVEVGGSSGLNLLILYGQFPNVEVAGLGLNLLKMNGQFPDVEVGGSSGVKSTDTKCAVAAAKLHMLVQTKLISSSAEASYLIGNLNSTIQQAVKDKTDNYSFLITVMKALIEKAHTLLSLDMQLPNLPTLSRSPSFFDDFKSYCFSEEWKIFMENYVTPQMEHFTESAFNEVDQDTKLFWSDCKKLMMENFHKRNREQGESKLKFQSQIFDVYKNKAINEERRFQNVAIHMKNQYSSTVRQWRASKRFFTGETGAWAERSQGALQWKMSNQENFSRMRVKLIPNYNFDLHVEASRQRDNIGVNDLDPSDQLKQLTVTKEALVSKENIADDIIGDEEWTAVNPDGTDGPNDKEKLVLSEECQLITMVNVYQGRLEVTTTHVYFFDCSTNKEEGGEDFKWALSQLREIHFRRYNLRRSALELFLIDQTNYFLNFQKKVRNKVYSRILTLRPPNLIYFGSRSPAELLKSSGLSQKWVHREITNFEYLMQLNTIAGRTYNDLSQYPVFPWIISDYESDTLNLNSCTVYRDLSKPIGAVNPKNEEILREKFETFEDPSGVIEKFHYGTHYSNAAGVMHYLLRMEPFTALHIELQGDRFDVTDRQFHSVPGTYKMLMENPNDVKELIPEFFYLPEFLVNENGFDLGKLQITREQVNDVKLPKWAESPEDFVHKNMLALESEYVSENLQNWIDLIFGYKQKGPAAAEALNVFYYCTYEVLGPAARSFKMFSITVHMKVGFTVMSSSVDI
ncbi:NEBL1_2 [Mytilus edulis]|uniref:NEBL1_2 n=1 Tax=Mytilus edulis TaxID=6550 RepID=A0A8S3RKV0_MYTED|nr:NEBL1_2 [Mytilus edulis]